MTRNSLNPTAASLLGFLHHGPQTGWDLIKLAEALIGDFWSLTRSQVYRELATMADDGLIEPGPTGPRDRRPYTVTAEGREAFAEWISQDHGSETIRFPLLLTVTFGEHLPAETLASILERHRRVHQEKLQEYERRWEQLGEDADPHVTATLQFGLHYERAVLGWFAGLQDTLGITFPSDASVPSDPD